ncbi:MAG TPA: hypothetical protein VKR22_05750 [Acidimicrobiales bacterium]|nr:hypothetical protein [Acidimicrobiales bacterium]
MTADPLGPFDPSAFEPTEFVGFTPAGFEPGPDDLAAMGPATHARLLEMARELPTIANKGDHAHLSGAASALLEAFVHHAESERRLVLRLPPFTARLVQNGQQRVVDRLVSLVLEADLAEQPCRCSPLAEEVASLIEVQIVSEEWDQSDR